MSVIIGMCVKYAPLLTKATVMTLVLSLISIMFSMVLGSLMALIKLSKVKLLRWFANFYVEFIRGTPLLVQIYLIFYGLPLLGISIPAVSVFGIDFESWKGRDPSENRNVSAVSCRPCSCHGCGMV